MATPNRFSRFLLRMLLMAIVCTTLYIFVFLFHLYMFDPLQKQPNAVHSNASPQSYPIDAILMDDIPDDQPQTPPPQSDTTMEPKPTEHIHINYQDDQHIIITHNKSSLLRPFDIDSISDLDLYSVSLANHFHHLYSNTSFQHSTFYALKPSCIRHDDNLTTSYIADCHDANALTHFHVKLRQSGHSMHPTSNHTNSGSFNSLTQRLQARKEAHSAQAAERAAAYQHSAQYVDPYNNDIDEEKANLPVPWDRYRVGNIQTVQPYQHLLLRSDSMRSLQAAKSTACFISHLYRFVFVHVLKSGGTSMSGFLCYALCNSTVITECPHQTLQKSPCKKLIGQYPDYFYFAVVRNPYNRIFSLWSHFLTMTLEKAASKKPNARNQDLLNRIQQFGVDVDDVENLTVHKLSRTDLLMLFAEFVWEKRFVGIKARNRRKSGVSSDHMYEQHWWLFNNVENAPIVDFIGHLEHIEFDMHFVLNLIKDNKKVMDYYVENGEFWRVNKFGNNIKDILYNNSKRQQDELNITSLTDIFRLSATLTGIDVKRWAAQLYEYDFKLFGYDMNQIEHNLVLAH